ncbi:MAG: FAD-dependent oxidoreductase [Myxococcales bacterium]|nr:FAD-dependent oxidoreductase [Myxococcales bacterium]
MRIAIIGGGAAGMITAYLLDQVHEITVFERQPLLGGNIRTLGGNVDCPALPPGVALDCGVIEFSPEHFVKLHRLFADLGVETRPVPAATGFIQGDGRHYLSLGKLATSRMPLRRRVAATLRLLGLGPALARFRRRAARADPEALYDTSLGDFLRDTRARGLGLGLGATREAAFHEWLRLLLVYAYSIPRAEIDATPATMTIPTLLRFTGDVSWTSVVGGIYRYIAAITERLRGEVITGVDVEAIRRDADGVELRRRGAAPERFDKVVLAATPEQVLRLLTDPSDAERRRFAAWRGNDAVVQIHTDAGMYRRRGIVDYSEFDVFAAPPGYNAHLNRLCGLPSAAYGDPGAVDYHFSYNLESEVDPAALIHTQRHRTPGYTVAALASRPEIVATNGDNHTYFAGAWLGDGLHEGAVTSALAVSERLGGRLL